MAGADHELARLTGDEPADRGGQQLIKRIKRVAFGMTKFAHYRIRVLLYAGKPNWTLLDTIKPR